MEEPGKFLVAFDFDHTIVDGNSDIVVRNLLPSHALTDKLESLRNLNGWTDYMQEVFNLLDEFGVDREVITESVVGIEPSPGITELLEYLKTRNCEVIIISDSNTYFIEEWLKKRDLKSCVKRVYSNPAEFKAGKLFIDKYHVQDWCTMSSVNLCKGHILEEHVRIRERDEVVFDYVVYVGDGQNDVCPSLRLSDKDLVFARSGMRLESVLSKADDTLKARLLSWDTAQTIIQHLEEPDHSLDQ